MGKRNIASKAEYLIQYNVLNNIFEPANDHDQYEDYDLQFIEDHIDRFHLNEGVDNPNFFFQFLKLVIDNQGTIPEYEYNHMAVEIFAKKLKLISRKEALKICETIYCAGFLKSGF